MKSLWYIEANAQLRRKKKMRGYNTTISKAKVISINILWRALMTLLTLLSTGIADGIVITSDPLTQLTLLGSYLNVMWKWSSSNL